MSKADLMKVRRGLDTLLHALESKLFCEECSQSKKWLPGSFGSPQIFLGEGRVGHFNLSMSD
jgi:hypothetical protein